MKKVHSFFWDGLCISLIKFRKLEKFNNLNLRSLQYFVAIDVKMTNGKKRSEQCFVAFDLWSRVNESFWNNQDP